MDSFVHCCGNVNMSPWARKWEILEPQGISDFKKKSYDNHQNLAAPTEVGYAAQWGLISQPFNDPLVCWS